MSEALSILVVDDDAVDRMAVRRALRDASLRAEVIEAEDADEAARKLAARAVDCVLLDLQLPGTDGASLLRSLRAGGNTVPVVMLTGHGDEQTAVEIMKVGASDYIPKSSLSSERLVRSVRQAIRLHAVEADAARARRQVEEAERRYRFLAESIPQMVWVARPDLSVEYVNQRWRRYTGFDLDAMNARTWGAIVHPDDLPTFLESWAEATSRGVTYEAQWRLRRSEDGAWRWHLHRAEALVSTEDGSVRWFGTSTDIEDQKRAERELARWAKDAERQRESSEEANRSKDAFLAVLSHELRTPLGSILGWAGMMRRGEVARAEWPRGLEVIERNARSQLHLVEDLLDVSRIISGQLRIHRAEVDLRAVAGAVADALRPTAAEKCVTLDARVEGAPVVIEGDSARLQQVIWNLLGNALKFTPAGGRVSLGLTSDGRRAEIVVEDTGEGIALDVLPHVFERFHQSEGPTERRHGGLGLGLSIVRSVVELHGGTIVAESDGEGRGARFTVRFPLVEARATPSLLPPPDGDVESALAGARVLVVDDDDDARELMSMALSMRGADVTTASCVAEAREAFARGAPQVLVSDIGMPGEDGYALIRHVRSLAASKGGCVPAVALTGFASVQDERRAREAGFTQHVAKPVDLPTLVRLVARMVGTQYVSM